MNIDLGKKIRLLRHSKGMTQEQLAEKLSVTAQSVSKWENGITAPDIQLIPEISVLFGITIDELFSMTDESRLERIENLLCTVSDDAVIPQKDFESYTSFLNEHINDPQHKSRIISALAGLYAQQSMGYRRLSAEYAAEAIELDPESKSDHAAMRYALNGAGHDWYAENHYRIIAHYTDYIRRHPDNVTAYQLLLDNLIADNRLEEAKALLCRFKSLDKSCRSMIYEARIAYAEHQPEKAVSILESMLSQYENDWLAQSYCGDFYAFIGEYEKALEYYENAFELQPAPRYTDNLLCIAEISVIMKNYKKAAEYFRKTAELLINEWNITEGERIDYYFSLAEKYSKLQMKDQTIFP